MVGNRVMRDRSASLPFISTGFNGRRNSDTNMNSWRNDYYFHGKEIGRGHFAKVYQVTKKDDDQTEAAAKVIRRRRGGSDKIENIRQEVKFMQKLWSEGIRSVVKLIDVHESLIEVALIMELAKGGSLYSVIQSHPKGLPETYVKIITQKVLGAISLLHSFNIVHLDIKADNILLRHSYPSTDAVLCDFGLAVQLSDDKVHRELVGTPDYIAPEVINYEKISVNTDMWSMGVLIYFLLSAKSPFLGDNKDSTMMNVSKINYSFPPDLFDDSRELCKDFISQLLIKEAQLRLTSKESLQHSWLNSSKHTEPQLDSSYNDVHRSRKQSIKIDFLHSIIEESAHCIGQCKEPNNTSSKIIPDDCDSGYESILA